MSATSVECREMRQGDEQAVLGVISRSFDRFVRPDFSDAGVAEFERSSRHFVLDRPEGHDLSVATVNGVIVGMLDIRDHSHIAHFFVDPDSHGRGIGRALFEWGVERSRRAQPTTETMTVNSSPWAAPVYEALGFTATAPLSEHNGIRYVPMAKPLVARG